MPTAIAFSIMRSAGAGRFSRPIGRPSRIVTPAMKPSSSVFGRLTGVILRVGDTAGEVRVS